MEQHSNPLSAPPLREYYGCSHFPSFQSTSPKGEQGGGSFVYFVHSFYVPVCKETAAITHYIHPFSAAMQKDNFFATQFHPEKSGKVGQQILRNFLELKI